MASELQKRLAAQRERADRAGEAAPAAAAPAAAPPTGRLQAADSELQERLITARARADDAAPAGKSPSPPAAGGAGGGGAGREAARSPRPPAAAAAPAAPAAPESPRPPAGAGCPRAPASAGDSLRVPAAGGAARAASGSPGPGSAGGDTLRVPSGTGTGPASSTSGAPQTRVASKSPQPADSGAAAAPAKSPASPRPAAAAAGGAGTGAGGSTASRRTLWEPDAAAGKASAGLKPPSSPCGSARGSPRQPGGGAEASRDDPPQTELQRRLLAARGRTEQPDLPSEPASVDGGSSASPSLPSKEQARPSPAVAQAALAAAKTDNVGPPFFNQSFLLKVSETLTTSVGKRFLAEVFEKYDEDHNGALSFSEVTEAAKGVYQVLGFPPLPQRVLSDLRDAAASAEAEAGVSKSFNRLGHEGFSVFFTKLMQKAKVKVKMSAFAAKPQGQGLRKGARPEVPQECPSLPEGLVVEVNAYSRCLVDYEEGAKKLRLQRFRAEAGRLPPRDGLVVIASYRQLRESREGGPKEGAYVVGVRDHATGEEYVFDGCGLRPCEPDEDELESHLRARREAAEVGKCLTVRDRLLEAAALQRARREVAKPGAAEAPSPKQAVKVQRPARKQLSASAFALFGAPSRASAPGPPPRPSPPAAAPAPVPAAAAAAAQGAAGAGGSGPPSRKHTAAELPEKPGREAAWLPEPKWLQAAVACKAEEEGCLELALGQWLCVEFIGAGEDEDWSYGSDESGARGWFRTDALGGWRYEA